MDYKARRRYTAIADVNDADVNYSHDIQIYDVPPVGEISLEEFQELGFDRLKGSLLFYTFVIIDIRHLSSKKYR